MKKPATSRLFAVVTYISDPAQIISIICAKSKQIRSFAYILHDRDEADPHHHLVIRTHNSRTCKEICNWFKDDINNQNTFAAFVESPEGILSYLTHANDPEQTQYDDSEVTDGGIADILTIANAKDATAGFLGVTEQAKQNAARLKSFGLRAEITLFAKTKKMYVGGWCRFRAKCSAMLRKAKFCTMWIRNG